MIKLQFETAIFLYLLISIFGIFVAWFTFLKIKLSSKDIMDIKSIWQCFICTYIYVDSKHKGLSLCPRCKSYNERGEAS